MTKKSLTKVAMATLAISTLIVLTACSTSGGNSAKPITKSTKATLNLWTSEAQSGPSATRTTQAQTEVNEFKKLYPNVTVKITYIPDAQFSSKVIASAATKSGPDILWINGAYADEYAKAGVIANISPYWKTYTDAKQFPASVLAKYKGGIYDAQAYVNLNGLWYNKTILDEYNLPVPKTLDEMQSDMATIQAGGKYAGLLAAGTTGVEGEWVSKPFFTAYGVSTYKDYGNPQTEKMFDLLTGWESKGYLAKSTVGDSQVEGWQAFSAGKTAFYVGGNWNLGVAAKLPFKWGVTPMPSGPGGAAHVYLGGQAESIGQFSSNKELAWTFLKDTWLTKSFGVYSLAGGSIPARTDALPANPSSAFTSYVTALKTGVQLSADTPSTLAIGNLWSGVLAGQTTPTQALVVAEQIAKSAK